MSNTVQTERFVGGKPTSGDPGDDILSKADLEQIANLLNVDQQIIPKLPRGPGISYQLVMLTEEDITKKPKVAPKARKKK